MNDTTFVIARNAHRRPVLMHVLGKTDAAYTACGRSLTGWSRSYLTDPPQALLDISLCRSCRMHLPLGAADPATSTSTPTSTPRRLRSVV